MSLGNLCKPRPNVFSADRRATVLDLDSFLSGNISGREFFDENYFTNGMLTLVDRAFRHLSGNGAGSSVFVLSQAMGGGKTHSMIGLGLLAQDPELRRAVLGEKNPAPNLGACRVVGFNGRRSDAPTGIWGSIAEQLGKADRFEAYVRPIFAAPGPEAWRQLLGNDPLIVMLDELPPYVENAAAVPVGNSNLSVVTTTAIANLFVAVSSMNNVCVILSDLAGTNYNVGQSGLQAAFDRAVQAISSEARRIAVPITPVNPNGDELYHILRKRLFQEISPVVEIERVASAYRDSIRDANSMGLTTTRPEAMFARVLDSYPFHPDLRELLGKFKENEGFQQTRGVIRLMQMVVSNLWRTKSAEKIDLIHPYNIDLNVDEIASEIRTINASLSEAIAHDIAHGGDAEVEQIDAANGNNDASEAARLLLIASLSTTAGAIHGLREHHLIDCLARPGRDLSKFQAAVLDKLATRAWYLHTSADGRLFFKNQQNLAAKLRSQALALHPETVERMLRDRLEKSFSPSLRDCYQNVSVMPPLDEVRIEQDKTTLVIVKPGGQSNQLPISVDWQDWWTQQQFKNRVIFLSGSRDTYQKVIDCARQARALQSIEDELKQQQTSAEDPQWRALDGLRDRIELQFRAALKEAFDQLVYPSINSALRFSGVELAFADNQNGEATIRRTLESSQKFTTAIADNSFREKAEARLFGSSETRVVLWSDLKRNAATNTSWPLHKPSALDDLRQDALRQGLWREEGNHVRRGPFPPPEPSVEIRLLSVDDENDGAACLKVEPLHANALVFETGNSNPTPASTSVPTPTRFMASELRYRFLAFDSQKPERLSPIKEWTATLRLRQQLHNRGNYYEIELLALPRAGGIGIRYTTDGSSPSSPSAVTYDGIFRVPDSCRIVCAMAVAPAFNIASEVIRISIPDRGGNSDPALNHFKPAKWLQVSRLSDSGEVWNFINKLSNNSDVVAFEISFTAESEDQSQNVDFSGASESGYRGEDLKNIANGLQALVGSGKLRLNVGTLGFSSGQLLLDWLRANNQSFDASKVRQDQ